jgi:hypothetical protein
MGANEEGYPQGGHMQADVLPLEVEVWRHAALGAKKMPREPEGENARLAG